MQPNHGTSSKTGLQLAEVVRRESRTRWARREVRASKPLLLSAVARAMRSGHQTTPYLAPIQGADLIRSLALNVRAAIHQGNAAGKSRRK